MGFEYRPSEIPVYKLHLFGSVAKHKAEFEAKKQEEEIKKMKAKKGRG